jgi:RNA polymerase sigma factor (sigma-70 family)
MFDQTEGRVAPDPLSELLAREEYQQVRSAIEKLSDRQRQVIMIRYQTESTFKAIGLLLGISEVAAHKLHSRAIEQLRTHLSCLKS